MSAPLTPTPAWLPVESAPKDGTRVDVWADGRRWPDLYWYDKHQAWAHSGWTMGRNTAQRPGQKPYTKTTIYTSLKPTHWQPLPPPPSLIGEE